MGSLDGEENLLLSESADSAMARLGRKSVVSPPNDFRAGGFLLSESEIQVMTALSNQHRLTFNQLMLATGLKGEKLRLVLGELQMRGHIARLQTVVESFCCCIAGHAVPMSPSQADCSAGVRCQAEHMRLEANDGCTY